MKQLQNCPISKPGSVKQMRLCWQNCTFWIAGLLWGSRAGRQPGNSGLFHSDMSQKSSLSWQPNTWNFGLLVWAGGHWLSVGNPLMQGSFFRGSWWAILWPGINPGMCMLQGFQAESSFQESLCTLAAVTFHWENKSRIKIFFLMHLLCKNWP